MPYATKADVADMYGQDALRNAAPLTEAGEVDGAAVARALADASSLMDASIGVRYTLPLAEPPGVLSPGVR